MSYRFFFRFVQIMFNCRYLSDILWHRYGVTLRHVFDCQVCSLVLFIVKNFSNSFVPVHFQFWCVDHTVSIRASSAQLAVQSRCRSVWTHCTSRWQYWCQENFQAHPMLFIRALIIIIIIIILITTIFMMLSSWQSHCESSPGSFDECGMAPSGRRPKTMPDDLGCESACTGCHKLHPPSPFIIITQPESWYSFYRPKKV